MVGSLIKRVAKINPDIAPFLDEYKIVSPLIKKGKRGTHVADTYPQQGGDFNAFMQKFANVYNRGTVDDHTQVKNIIGKDRWKVLLRKANELQLTRPTGKGAHTKYRERVKSRIGNYLNRWYWDQKNKFNVTPTGKEWQTSNLLPWLQKKNDLAVNKFFFEGNPFPQETLSKMMKEIREMGWTIPGNTKSGVLKKKFAKGFKPTSFNIGSKPNVLGLTKTFDAINSLDEVNRVKVFDFLGEVAKFAPIGKTKSNVRSTLTIHLDRMVKQALIKKIPEEEIIETIRKTDPEKLSNLFSKKYQLQQKVIQAKDMGMKIDDLNIGHMEAVVDNWKLALDIDNLFIVGKKANYPLTHNLTNKIKNIQERIKKAVTFSEKKTIASEMKDIRQQLLDNNIITKIEGKAYGKGQTIGEIEQGLDSLINTRLSHTILNKGGLVRPNMAGGGLIKKLLGESLGMMSRRKFLKGMGATAAHAALPKSAMKLAAPVAQAAKLSLPDAVPWVKSMTNMLKGVVDSKKGIKLPNGTEIFYLKKPHTQWDSHKLSIKTADGSEDLVNFKEGKNDFEIEFDIADDFATNQYLEVNKKTGYTEMIDSNFRMAPGGEDIIKDDPIVWAMEKADVRDRMILDKTTKPDDYMYDYMSVPDDTDYAHLFERYVDSFSPAGNIFKTKELARAQKARELKLEKAAQERQMDNWESQFRGGNIHGYYRGGASMRDYPRARNMDLDKLVDAVGMAETSPAYMKKHNLGPRHLYKSPSDNRGTYGTGRLTAMDPGEGYEQYGATRWTDFDKTWRNPNKQRSFTKNYLKGMIGYYTANPDAMIYGSDPYYEALLRYGPVKTKDNPDPRATGEYFNRVMKFYDPNWKPTSFNKGGTVEKPYTVEDAVREINANPQRFMAGGLVKKLFAPKVLGKRTNYKPKLTSEQKFIGPIKLDRPYTAFDEAGFPVKDFKTRLDAEDFVKDEPLYSVGFTKTKNLEPEKPGAMFWGSREKIIGAPSESMTGKQWLQYLQLGKHGILNPKGFPIVKHMELNDTGLAPHLSKMGNKTVTKEQLVKDFDDKLAPEIDVVALGGSSEDAGKIYSKIMKYDMQAYRPGPVKNVLQSVRNTAYPLKEAIQNNNQEAVSKIIDAIEGSVFNNTGVANSIREGFPQKFPYELKKILQDISQVTKTRLAGFDEYYGGPQYKGTQTLSGGENYREFVFKYKHPRGSLRETEPYMTYGQVAKKQGAPEHFTSLADRETMGGFMHMRISDRTDEFGRRVLHIEEIQADMHQAMNRKQREIKRMIEEGRKPSKKQLAEAKYAPRGDLIAETVDKANEEQLGLILAKIDEIQSGPMTKKKQIRLNRLNKERVKIRKIIEEKKDKMAKGDHSGVPMGPLSKTEDYNEFVMKYAVKVAQEGGYDGVTISSAAIKNRGIAVGNRDYRGNLIAYGPMAEGAMKKAAKKSGAKFIKTAIMDGDGRGWEVPMIWLDDAAKFNIQKGTPIYKKGGMVVNG